MGDLFSPTPSILFSSLFFMLRRRNEACATTPEKQRPTCYILLLKPQFSVLKYGRDYTCQSIIKKTIEINSMINR